jgi:hypothetical protein
MPHARTAATIAGLFSFALLVVLTGAPPVARNTGTEGPAANVLPRPWRETISFRDSTERAGISRHFTRSWGSAWADFSEGDGFPDLFVGRHGFAPWVYSNTGTGRFEHRDEIVQEGPMDRHGCAWGEANSDGRIDLYCAQGADMGQGKGPNQLFIATDNGYREVAGSYGIADPLGRGRSVNWIDYDGDGDLDIFVGNEHRPGASNVLFRRESQRFHRVDAGLSSELHTVSSSWADWDGDGDPDLLVLQKPPAPAIAYENLGGRFAPTALRGVTGRSWVSAAWGDFDGDGRSDLHLVSETLSEIWKNLDSGFELVHSIPLHHGRMSVWLDVDNDARLDSFVVQGSSRKNPYGPGRNAPDFLVVQRPDGFKVAQGWVVRGYSTGRGDAVSTADFDRDGRTDLFVTNGLGPFPLEIEGLGSLQLLTSGLGRLPSTGRSLLLQNESQAGNWVGLTLEGDSRNPLGFGARLRVTAGSITYWRELTDNFNFRSQSEVGYVGLGLRSARSATIEVMWPNGVNDCVSATAGEIVSVSIGSHPCG